MYLELVSRIPVVAARTQVGTQRLQEAQDAVGLSNEAVARLIPCSEKTWRRWKEAGEVPTASLPAVARALRLRLNREELPPLEMPMNGDHATATLRENRDVLDRLDRIEEMLARLLDE